MVPTTTNPADASTAIPGFVNPSLSVDYPDVGVGEGVGDKSIFAAMSPSSIVR